MLVRHSSVWHGVQELELQVSVSHAVTGSCQVDEYDTSRFVGLETIFYALCQKSHLIGCRPSMSDASLLFRLMRVDDWPDASIYNRVG